MHDRTFSLAPAASVVVAAVGMAVIMFVTVGLAEALVLLAVVAVLSGAYGLRRYARARLIYNRSPDRQRPLTGGSHEFRRPPNRPHQERNDMRQWRVQDVMTTDVITGPGDARVADVVTLLTARRVSAVPVVDEFGTVLGVVSWSDLHEVIEMPTPADQSRTRWWRRRIPPRPSWPDGTAAGVMNGPPLTIRADASLPAAARLMHRHAVGRLLVVDADHKLLGIVSRSDLFKVHDRLDAVIRDDVIQRVLLDDLRIRPGAVQVTVDDGVVTLTGRTARRTTAIAAARMTELIPGVTDVVDLLTSDVDEAAPASGTTPAVRKATSRRHVTSERNQPLTTAPDALDRVAHAPLQAGARGRTRTGSLAGIVAP
jgi:CBS domain-containing protein